MEQTLKSFPIVHGSNYKFRIARFVYLAVARGKTLIVNVLGGARAASLNICLGDAARNGNRLPSDFEGFTRLMKWCPTLVP